MQNYVKRMRENKMRDCIESCRRDGTGTDASDARLSETYPMASESVTSSHGMARFALDSLMPSAIVRWDLGRFPGHRIAKVVRTAHNLRSSTPSPYRLKYSLQQEPTPFFLSAKNVPWRIRCWMGAMKSSSRGWQLICPSSSYFASCCCYSTHCGLTIPSIK